MSDATLRALDAELTRVYELATAPSSTNGDSIRKTQAAWSKTRDACAGNASPDTCARDLTIDRIAKIREQSSTARSQDDHGISLGPVEYTCAGIKGIVTAAFINSQPSFARIQNQRRVWIMTAASSGSGARYLVGGEESGMFWSHGRDALFRTDPGKAEVTCKPAGAG
jgi:uncharacterized protein